MLRKLLMTFAAAALLSACAQPAKMQSMVVQRGALTTPKDPTLVKAIFVRNVSGGEETNPLWTSEVDNRSFRGALELSLLSHDVVRATLDGSTYVLDANLLGVSQPAFGFDLTVNTHVNYTLRKKDTEETYFATSINASHTATVGDAFIAIVRLQLANEGSIRENIRQFLQQLFAKSPPKPPAPRKPPAPGLGPS